jgi:alpha-tubulin suppressor-like RCC1 family protein
LGDGVIHSILAGCVNYTFGTPVADTPVDTTMYLSVSTLNPEPAPLLRGSFGSPSLEAGAEIHSTEFNYRTFIPYFDLAQSPDPTDQPIAAACAAVDLFNKIPDEHGALTFLGDNRDVAAPTPGLQDYRTMMDYRYNWDTGLPDKQTDVGITKVYDITAGKVIAQDEANKSNMTFLHEVTADNYAAVTFHHVANDPFCPSWLVYGAIVYNVRVEMYRSGLITVYGARNAMPVHEGWVRWNDQQTWSNVFALEARGLKCLAIGPGAPFYCMDRIHASTTRSTDRWTDVSASGGGTLATTASGRSYGWGTNNGGNFLSPYNYAEYCQTDDPLPVPQANASTHRNVQQVFLGRYNSTVLTATGKAYTWGSARFYGANLGRVGIDELATAVSTESFVNVDTSRNGMTTYAVAANGDLYAWGLRIKDLSVISENYYFSPTLVDSSHDFVNVQIGEGYVLALDASGQVWGYGYNNGQLGDLPFDWNGSWTAIPVDGVVFDSFAMEGDTVFALDTVGQLWSWGYPDVPMAGIAPEDAYNLVVEPTLVDTPVEFSYLRGGISKNVSAIAANGDLYSWYDGAGYGALADFALPSPNQPVIDLVDSRAITESGELLQLTSAYVDGQWVLSWLNLGLPPVTTLSNPPFTCNYPS